MLHIPNNEIDALLLGVSIEILVRTFNGISKKDFIKKVTDAFERKHENAHLIDSDFWQAVEKIVCSEGESNDTITINTENNLLLKSYNVPIDALNELVCVVRFLSLLIPIDTDITDRIRELLRGQYENINLHDNKINIALNAMCTDDVDMLIDCYLKDLPDISSSTQKHRKNGNNYMIITSKWINIKIELYTKKSYNYTNASLYYHIKEVSKKSTTRFLKFENNFTYNRKHISLSVDEDLMHFIESGYCAMFIVGTSGSGKTSALQNLINSLQKEKNINSIIVSPKNTDINKYGLHLFFNYDSDDINETVLLKNINNSLEYRGECLILIFDGLNEINDTLQKQKIHYCELLELARAIYRNQCNNIKLIITCRESAYNQYKSETMMQVSPVYFYSNDLRESFIDNKDSCYRITPLTDEDKLKIISGYVGNSSIQLKNKSLPIQRLIEDATTPFFAAILGESLMITNIKNILRNSSSVYDLFAATMLNRIEQTESFLAKKIIYTYFDLVLNSHTSNFTVTEFKILDCLPVQWHDRFGEIVNKLLDVNILLKDYSGAKRIRFKHDRIEEFFFKNYIIEYEHNGISFFKKIIRLSYRNVIYRSGILQYFNELINCKKLKMLKDISIALFNEHMHQLSLLVVEALSYSSDLQHNLAYLLNSDDEEDSKRMLNIIIWGLDSSLIDYSILTYDLMNLIDNLLQMINSIITDEKRASLYHFKSKLYYFVNDYINANKYANKAIEVVGKSNRILLSEINIQSAVILIELGYSKKSVELLENEFTLYRHSNNSKLIMQIGIELGRALNHCGQIGRTLELYETLLSNKNEINNPYILARIYEQKANVLNNIMFEKLQHGLLQKKDLSTSDINEVQSLFEDAIELYDNSAELLLKTNAIFKYSGVVPEIINTYISYSYSIDRVGIEKCKQMISEIDSLFNDINTPFETDFYLSKAYYHEYNGDFERAETCINHALETAVRLNIKNKEAKCHTFASRFIYRYLNNHNDDSRYYDLMKQGIHNIEMAVAYYEKYTLLEDNVVVQSLYRLKDKYNKLLNN